VIGHQELPLTRNSDKGFLKCQGQHEGMTMNNTEIIQLRKKLELQRSEVLQFLRQLEEEKHSLDSDITQDPADQSVNSVSKESLFEQSSQRRTILRLIEAALRRIDDGTFGECSGCSEDIPSRRLQALPWTQYCLSCQEAVEREVGTGSSRRGFTLPAPALRKAG
jgi:DnaK suppressor protein